MTLNQRASGITCVDLGTVLNGELEFASATFVAGQLQGQIRAAAPLHIEASGVVDGDLTCHELTVSGEFKGTLRCQKLIVLAGGSVDAQAYVNEMEVQDTGQFIGTRQMGVKPEELPKLAELAAKQQTHSAAEQATTMSAKVSKKASTNLSAKASAKTINNKMPMLAMAGIGLFSMAMWYSQELGAALNDWFEQQVHAEVQAMSQQAEAIDGAQEIAAFEQEIANSAQLIQDTIGQPINTQRTGSVDLIETELSVAEQSRSFILQPREPIALTTQAANSDKANLEEHLDNLGNENNEALEAQNQSIPSDSTNNL